MKVCAEPGCPALQAEPRCLEHRRQRERARGTRQQRGYDAAHDQLRADWQRRLNTGERATCWRCGNDLDPKAWTLGHCDDDRTIYHGPECPACDYATAGRTMCPHPSHA
ncbi:hypothetical protein GCM10027076_03620 [Nocardioides montaniterrae]